MTAPSRSVTDPSVTHSAANPDATTGGESPAPTPAPPPPHTRYVLGEEIARGGMGEVYRATDTALDRPVAVKVLQAKFGPHSVTARRFADEARITAQLQHPSVPSVHDLGTLPDGRPFLAMKLIKGDTLDRLLKVRPTPADDRGRFVGVFEQVCHALGYAHAHGVIHRDLKPANVMVGAFGEVQVMDWGLAKVLANPNSHAGGASAADPEATRDPDPTEVKSLRDDGDTQAGSVLGTPAYMAPEQAIGAVGKLDRRTDVFGLGAVLAVILTGRPPFAASSTETTRVKAAQGDVADCYARLDWCGAEPELVALCKRCLSPKAADRPAHAGEVAAAVAGLRAAADDRARQAEIARARAAVVVVEQQSRGRLRTRLLVALLAACGVAAGAVVYGQKVTADRAADDLQRQAEEQRRQGDEALRASEDRARQEKDERERAATAEVTRAAVEQMYRDLDAGRWVDARFSLTRATDHLRRTPDMPAALAAEIRQAEKDLTTAAELDGLRSEIPDNRSDDGLAAHAAPARAFLDAYARYGLADWRDPAAVAAAINSSRIYTHLRQCLYHLTVVADAEFRPLVMKVTRQTLKGLDPWQNRLFAAKTSRDPAALAAVADDPETYRRTAFEIYALAINQTSPDTRLSVLRRGQLAYPTDVWLQLMLAIHLKGGSADERWEAVGHARSVVALRPQSAHGVLLLAQTLSGVGKHEQAADVARQAVALSPNDAVVRSTVAGVLLAAGHRAEAIDQYREGVARRRKLVALDPKQVSHQTGLINACRELGNVVRDGDRPADSLDWYGQALDDARRLFDAQPKDQSARWQLWQCHWHRALAYERLNRFTEAADDTARVVELAPPDLAWAHYQHARMLDKAGERAKAEAAWVRGLTLREAAVKPPTAGREPHWLLATYQFDCGGEQSAAGRWEAAADWYARAAAALAVVAERWPAADVKDKRRWAHQHRATALGKLKKHADAVIEWGKAAALCPAKDRPALSAERVKSLHLAGRTAEAVAEADELRWLPGWSAGQLYDLACVYSVASAEFADMKAEYSDAAVQLLRRAVKAGLKVVGHMKKDPDLDALRERDDFKRLLADLEAKYPPKKDPPPPEKK